ncbi:MAG: hypothetical protein AAB255_04885 [Bacteroidota bacterium]
MDIKIKKSSFLFFAIVKILILTLLVNFNLMSQIRGMKYDEKLLFQGMTGLTFGVNSQSWKINDFGNVSQQSIPISITFPFTNRILFALTNTPVVTKRSSTATEINEAKDDKISTISDTRLSLSYILPGDKIWLNSSLNLPTGLTKLDVTQFEIARVVSQSGFGFRVPVFGQGTNGTFGVTNAYNPKRRLTIGFGASIGYKGKFNPYIVKRDSIKTESTYDPGEDLSINFGADYTMQSKKSRISSDITVIETFADKINARKSFKSGRRTNLFLVYSYKNESISHFATFRGRIKSKNTIFIDTSQMQFSASNQIELQYTYRWSVTEKLSLSSFVDFKIHNGDQIPFGEVVFEIGRARVGSLGAEIGIIPFRRGTVAIGLKYNIGSVAIEENYYKANGIDLSLNSRILF